MQNSGTHNAHSKTITSETESTERGCGKFSSARELTSGCASLLVLAVTLIVLSVNHIGTPPKEMGMHGYLVDWAQSGNNINLLSQREAHASALLVIAICVLIGTKFADKVATLTVSSAWTISSILLVTGFCLSGAIWWMHSPVSKIGWVFIAITFALLAFGRTRLLKMPLFSGMLLALAGLAGALAVAPGLFVPYDASWMPPGLLIEFQQGYSVVSSQCDRVAMGQQIFKDIKPNYGFLLPVVCGLWERHHSMFSFGDNIQIIRLLQVLTVAIFFGVYCWYARCRPLPVLMGFLLVLPWFHTNHISLLFPNLSPWRSFGFPIAALLLILSFRLSKHARILALSFTSVLCLSINLETGIAITVGLASYLFFECRQAGNPLSIQFYLSMAAFMTGTVLFAVVLYLFLSACLGYFPDVHAYFHHVQAISAMMRTGYAGGFRIEYAPLAVLFFCHYTYILFRDSLSVGGLTQRECFRGFAVSTALVWSAYYFNRPNEWYFQPQFFFYGFLLMDTVKIAQCRKWKSPTFENRTVAFTVITCLIIPQITTAFQTGLPYYDNLRRQLLKGKTVDPKAVLLSEIYITPEAAEDLKKKAEFLVSENKREKVIYLTGSTVLIPKLSKLYLKANFDDPFMELVSPVKTNAFIDSIKKSDINEVLIDGEKSYLAGDKYRQSCWRYFENHLAPEFEHSSTQKGWKVLRRVQPRVIAPEVKLELQQSK